MIAPSTTLFSESPFDQIKRLHPNGAEYWSARDLMSLLGYAKWQKFEDAIDRAKATCQNSGFNPGEQFTASGKMVSIGSGASREAADYELTRYACYLVAMNGDPRKPEIAGAQSYFAVKTREAEVYAPKTYKEALQALIAKEEEKEALALKIAALEPQANWAEEMLKTKEGVSIRDAAKVLRTGEKRLFQWLRENRYLMSDNVPYQIHVDAGLFVVSERKWCDKERQTHVYVKTLITPKGVRKVHDQLVAAGDIPRALEIA